MVFAHKYKWISRFGGGEVWWPMFDDFYFFSAIKEVDIGKELRNFGRTLVE